MREKKFGKLFLTWLLAATMVLLCFLSECWRQTRRTKQRKTARLY